MKGGKYTQYDLNCIEKYLQKIADGNTRTVFAVFCVTLVSDAVLGSIFAVFYRFECLFGMCRGIGYLGRKRDAGVLSHLFSWRVWLLKFFLALSAVLFVLGKQQVSMQRKRRIGRLVEESGPVFLLHCGVSNLALFLLSDVSILSFVQWGVFHLAVNVSVLLSCFRQARLVGDSEERSKGVFLVLQFLFVSFLFGYRRFLTGKGEVEEKSEDTGKPYEDAIRKNMKDSGALVLVFVLFFVFLGRVFDSAVISFVSIFVSFFHEGAGWRTLFSPTVLVCLFWAEVVQRTLTDMLEHREGRMQEACLYASNGDVSAVLDGTLSGNIFVREQAFMEAVSFSKEIGKIKDRRVQRVLCARVLDQLQDMARRTAAVRACYCRVEVAISTDSTHETGVRAGKAAPEVLQGCAVKEAPAPSSSVLGYIPSLLSSRRAKERIGMAFIEALKEGILYDSVITKACVLSAENILRAGRTAKFEREIQKKIAEIAESIGKLCEEIDVLHRESRMVFGRFELSSADKRIEKIFSLVERVSMQTPETHCEKRSLWSGQKNGVFIQEKVN
ncbi:MAG: uncharacterized protein A8A55_0824 [Amphiamblys sp. WSBS2006]|nr:MAG: uncharacterized protein A8A55_0824 [Amphiamblys sp. WSBS2006]